jgi:hypothetical protein
MFGRNLVKIIPKLSSVWKLTSRTVLSATFLDFIQTFLITKGGQLESNGMLSFYSSLLTKSIADSFVLLPQGVLDLFSIIRTRKWDSEKMVALIFHKFLWPPAFQSVSNPSTCHQCPALKSLLEEISMAPS